MYACSHTYVHAYKQTYIQIYIDGYNVYRHKYMFVRACSHILAYTHITPSTHAHGHAHTHALAHARGTARKHLIGVVYLLNYVFEHTPSVPLWTK